MRSQLRFAELVQRLRVCYESSNGFSILRADLRKLYSLPGLRGPDHYSECINLRGRSRQAERQADHVPRPKVTNVDQHPASTEIETHASYGAGTDLAEHLGLQWDASLPPAVGR